MPDDVCKSMCDATRRKRSTVGKGSDADKRIGQAIASLEDPRQRRFVERFVETGNATQSAVVAGYPARSARTVASRLLRKAHIKDAVSRRNAEIMDALDFNPTRVIREIAQVARVNLADFTTIDEVDGTLAFDFRTTTRMQLAALSSIEREESDSGSGSRRRNKVKTHDKLRALDMLARILRMYPADRTELTGADGGPIATTHRIDIENLNVEQREQLRAVLLALKARQIEAERSSERG
jgi:phage terminase small subunit